MPLSDENTTAVRWHLAQAAHVIDQAHELAAEPADELRRRLPTTQPFQHAQSPSARTYMRETGATLPAFPQTPSRDLDPIPFGPQEPTHAAETEATERLTRRIADLEQAYDILQRFHVEAPRRLAALEQTTASLEERTNDHDARLDQLHDGGALAHASTRDLDARLSALEITTRNVTEMQRELGEFQRAHNALALRLNGYVSSMETREAPTLPAIDTGVYEDLMQYARDNPKHAAAIPDTADPSTVAWQTSGHDETTDTPYRDDDQRLGGHDNPTPNPRDDDDQAHEEA